MSFRRSKSNAEQIREMRRRRDTLRRQEDARIAELVRRSGATGGAQ